MLQTTVGWHVEMEFEEDTHRTRAAALVRLPEPLGGDSLAAAERLLEQERVVTVPGRAFGESGEGWLRLSWAGPPDVVSEGLRRIGEFLRR